ncbi:putative nicotinamide N-methyase [Roseibium hamelinense]|uniref:Putative nicotinamide N-methyase n=1 Tax=Roseibium hamelinense TaxID=150831 RepID=A0A562SF09_9HYPH|nr:methyltransferase [Roseibium hamelinense]MTI42899.1 methyltransferase [Roseibium hamelinense]TWI79931.1 putative nicotinamide N-methyase [Roseibium hamelinense]
MTADGTTPEPAGNSGRISDPAAFIRSETKIKTVPHAEEIRLHLADEAMSLWLKTEDELGELGLPPPFWAFAWAGGQGLARYILDHPASVIGKSVMDFASGSGLVGIAAMMAGARSCICADIDPFAEIAGRLNADLNQVTLIHTRTDVLDGPPPNVDLVFSGDVFYDKPMAERVLAFLDRARCNGSDVLIGDPGRSYLPKNRLQELASYSVPIVGALEDSEIKKTSIFRLQPRQ